MRLEISDDLVIYLFRNGESIPFFEQPNYPNNFAWQDRADCERWGQAYLNWMTNPDVYPQPPLSPNHWAAYEAALPQE